VCIGIFVPIERSCRDSESYKSYVIAAYIYEFMERKNNQKSNRRNIYTKVFEVLSDEFTLSGLLSKRNSFA